MCSEVLSSVMKSVVRLDVTHTGLGTEFRELPFPSSTTLAELKEKLYKKFGNNINLEE